ncbi:hypothetical protein CCR75_009500 [Bremia lactucae]|uniref:Uncharacterized protein n=1 Tax=Bremia lactucae TaxID=4779 RepID=A0A976IF05_BRELC|nr:hypothetical protein CCR75_009500 [Bremia lactucae]
MENDGQHTVLETFQHITAGVAVRIWVTEASTMPCLAPVEDETKVVMLQSKAVLCHLSKKERAAVFSILCSSANWQPTIDLIARDGHPQY